MDVKLTQQKGLRGPFCVYVLNYIMRGCSMQKNFDVSEIELISEMAQEYKGLIERVIAQLQDVLDYYNDFEAIDLDLSKLKTFFEELKAGFDKSSIHCVEDIAFISVAMQIYKQKKGGE